MAERVTAMNGDWRHIFVLGRPGDRWPDTLTRSLQRFGWSATGATDWEAAQIWMRSRRATGHAPVIVLHEDMNELLDRLEPEISPVVICAGESGGIHDRANAVIRGAIWYMLFPLSASTIIELLDVRRYLTAEGPWRVLFVGDHPSRAEKVMAEIVSNEEFLVHACSPDDVLGVLGGEESELIFIDSEMQSMAPDVLARTLAQIESGPRFAHVIHRQSARASAIGRIEVYQFSGSLGSHSITDLTSLVRARSQMVRAIRLTNQGDPRITRRLLDSQLNDVRELLAGMGDDVGSLSLIEVTNREKTESVYGLDWVIKTADKIAHSLTLGLKNGETLKTLGPGTVAMFSAVRRPTEVEELVSRVVFLTNAAAAREGHAISFQVGYTELPADLAISDAIGRARTDMVSRNSLSNREPDSA